MNQGETTEHGSATPLLVKRGLALVAVLVFCGMAIGLYLLFLREHERVRQVMASRDELKAALAQTRAQLDGVSAKLNTLAALQARPQAAEPAAESRPAVRRTPRVVTRRPAPLDPRVKKLQTDLADQQKQLAGTQEELKKAREELQGNLNSTRDELNGSIARNHEELVQLQKRGERNYYEFDLVKSKQFQRTGPIGLSLRKTDTKHKRFDLMLLVEDAQLEKKRVNLFEPVLVYVSDRPQPVELVVNQIGKNQIKGYVSEPKYKKSELATSATVPAKQQELTPRR